MNLDAIDAVMHEFMMNLAGSGSPLQKGGRLAGDDQLRHDTKQFATELSDFTREFTRQSLEWAKLIEKAGDRKLPGAFRDVRQSMQHIIQMLETREQRLAEFEKRAEQMVRT